MSEKTLSLYVQRNNLYCEFIDSINHKMVCVNDIIKFGQKLMQKEKLSRHFFGENSIIGNWLGTSCLYGTARYLTFYALKLPYEFKNKNYLDKPISQQDAKKVFSLFEKRISERIPVEYITNECWYLNNKFYVNQDVIVPRSIMHTRFEDFLKGVTWQNYRVLDLCAGSGCIGISLALLNKDIKVDLVDISPKALDVARINISNYNLADRVKCIQSDLFNNLENNKYDLIITNPPYVPKNEYDLGSEEFKNEPKMALESGADGLNHIHRIIFESRAYLNPNGKLIAEVGYTAPKLLKKIYSKVKFKWFHCRGPKGSKSIIDYLPFGLKGIFMCERAYLP